MVVSTYRRSGLWRLSVTVLWRPASRTAVYKHPNLNGPSLGVSRRYKAPPILTNDQPYPVFFFFISPTPSQLVLVTL